MKIILVYDISDINNLKLANKKLNKVRKICTRYLFHVQNSVFEGELESYQLIKLKNELLSVIDKNKDSIIIFSFKSFSKENVEVIGIKKNKFDNFTI